MSPNTKLPTSIQLVGLTAVLVFSVSTVTTYSYVRAIVLQWHLIPPMSRTWEGFYYPIFSAPAYYTLLAIISAAAFLSLLRASRASLVKISLVYLAFLLVAAGWCIYTHIPPADSFGFRGATKALKIYLGIHVFYVICVIALAYCVLPNNSLKRTAECRER